MAYVLPSRSADRAGVQEVRGISYPPRATGKSGEYHLAVTSVTYGRQYRSFRIARSAIETAPPIKNLGSYACLPHGGAGGGVRPAPAWSCSCSF
jgi:hypothetical protein